MQYYFCVACGFYGNFTFKRQKNIKCESCSYDDLCELNKTEYKQGPSKRRKKPILKNNIDYSIRKGGGRNG